MTAPAITSALMREVAYTILRPENAYYVCLALAWKLSGPTGIIYMPEAENFLWPLLKRDRIRHDGTWTFGDYPPSLEIRRKVRSDWCLKIADEMDAGDGLGPSFDMVLNDML